MSESTAAGVSFPPNSSSTGDPESGYSVIPQSQEYFSSSNATYCESTDTTCTACRTQWVEAYQYDSLRSADKFSCIGGGGCICTAYCELRAYAIPLPSSYNVGQETCTATSTDDGGLGVVDIQTVLNSCAILLGAFVLALAVRWGVKSFHEGERLALNSLILSWTLNGFPSPLTAQIDASAD